MPPPILQAFMTSHEGCAAVSLNAVQALSAAPGFAAPAAAAARPATRAGIQPSFTGAVAASNVSIGSHTIATWGTPCPATATTSCIATRPPMRQ